MVDLMPNALLSGSGQVVLSGSGYGVISFAPQGELWEIQGVTMQTSDYTSPTLEATGRIYTDVVSPLNVRAVSMAASTGSTATAQGDPIRLTDGQRIWFEWTGGTPGVTATVTFRGVKSNPTGGFRAVR
jgi:hypothetical protein